MFILNGKPLPLDTPFQVRGTQYPANWLRLSTEAEKTAIGITEVEDPVRPDDRYYWVSQNEDGTFTAIPKDLDDLKKQSVSQVKTTAGTLIAPTDCPMAMNALFVSRITSGPTPRWSIPAWIVAIAWPGKPCSSSGCSSKCWVHSVRATRQVLPVYALLMTVSSSAIVSIFSL